MARRPLRHENSEFVALEFEQGVADWQITFAGTAVTYVEWHWSSQHPEDPKPAPPLSPPDLRLAREADGRAEQLFSAGEMARGGDSAAAQKNYTSAIAQFDEAIRDDPTFEPAYRSRCAAFDRLGNYRRAMLDCTHALRLPPADALAYRWRGDAQAGLKRWEFALNDYDQAIRLKSDDHVFYNQRAWAYSNTGQYESCVESATEGIRLASGNTTLLGNRASCYRKLGKYDLAIADATQVIDLTHDANDYNRRGLIYTDAKQYAKAITDFSDAIRLKPDFKDAFNNRGFAKDMSGDSAGAAADRKYALQLGK